MKNKEIEIKLRITETDYERLQDELQTRGRFIQSVEQEERYYIPKDKRFIDNDGYIWEWLRLRKQKDKNIVTYKHVKKGPANEWRENDEYEFEVSDASQYDLMIRALGFDTLIEFTKHRKIYKYKKSFEIVLDYVEELGYFIEIEGKFDEDTKDFNEEEALESIALELGLSLEDESTFGYPHLLLMERGILEKPKKAL